MHRPPHVTRFIAASFGLHVLLFTTMIYFASRIQSPPIVTPVNIVNLPQEILQRLPPLSRPSPPTPGPAVPVPDRQVPQAPAPSRAGDAGTVHLPRTVPQGQPKGNERGTAPKGTSDAVSPNKETGPLPFLSQADIDELARKGMPERRPGDNSVTLDTDEFKFMSYNRWLKIKVENVLQYPELAAVSGLQGTLYIQFDIMKDGSLGGLELLKSSGYKILDDEALRSIRAAAPFQPLPESWSMDRYTIRAAVLFYLNGAYLR